MSRLSTLSICFTISLLALGKSAKLNDDRISANRAGSGKSPAGRWCSRMTWVNWFGRSSISLRCAFSSPNKLGNCLRRCPTSSMWILRARIRFTKSLILRSQLLCGMSYKLANSSFCSASKSDLPFGFFSVLMGASALKEPTYTRQTSGVLNTLPRLHMRAPYTRINCCWSTWSALLRIIRILSSWPLIAVITDLNSSEISSFAGSNSRKIRSQRAANH
mmetsp:Transcript_19149/g.32939  ORF Transcript_19149/g.32939 Transcript_19149/m.32939 type:complete len:219 (-) Transcript_19149:1280-1936(-)